MGGPRDGRGCALLTGLYNKGLPRPTDLTGQLASCQDPHKWTKAGSVLQHLKQEVL